MWCDQAKSVWSRSNSVFIFLSNCMHYFHSYILQKIPLNFTNWFQRYEQLKDAKNNRKQKICSALFGSILKLIFPTSDWFCLITSHMMFYNQPFIFCGPPGPPAMLEGPLRFSLSHCLYGWRRFLVNISTKKVNLSMNAMTDFCQTWYVVDSSRPTTHVVCHKLSIFDTSICIIVLIN